MGRGRGWGHLLLFRLRLGAWPWKDLGLCIPSEDPVLSKLRLLEHPQHPAWDPGIGATTG